MDDIGTVGDTEPGLRDVVHRRMHQVGLSGPRFESPAEVVGWFGAVQAQDYGPAKWSVASRTVNCSDRDVEDLFGRGGLLRTHLLRPTWHLVLPGDIRWLLELTGPRVQAGNASMYRQLELDRQLRSRCQRLIERWLRADGALTRREIADRLGGERIDSSGMRLGYILMSAELDGLVCSGPRHGKQHTYALVEHRAPDAPALPPDAALAELTRRYFTSHGPATVNDFRWWSSLKVVDIRRGLEMVGDELEPTELGDLVFWGPPGPSPPPVARPTVRLLQPYDEYVVGYRESKRLLRLAASEWDPTAQPRFNGVVLLDGQVFGVWKPSLGRDAVEVEVVLDREPAPAEHRSLVSEVTGYGRFHGRSASLTIHR